MSHAQDHINEDLFDTSCEKCREEIRRMVESGEKGNPTSLQIVTKKGA